MESVSLTFTVVNDAVPDYCPFCVNFIRKTFFVENNHFLCHFSLLKPCEVLQGVYYYKTSLL